MCLWHTPLHSILWPAPSLTTADGVRVCRAFPLILFSLCPQNIKLSSIKVDTRYTTTQQVVKLIGSHTISKVTVKIGDLKRTKMVRTVNLYYNNRTVQAIVELKNKWVAWLGLTGRMPSVTAVERCVSCVVHCCFLKLCVPLQGICNTIYRHLFFLLKKCFGGIPVTT